MAKKKEYSDEFKRDALESAQKFHASRPNRRPWQAHLHLQPVFEETIAHHGFADGDGLEFAGLCLG